MSSGVLPTVRKIELVVFDLDGTLVDSTADIAHAMNRVLRSVGRGEHSLAAYDQFIGAGARELVLQALGADFRGSVDELLDRFREEYANALVVDTGPFAGIRELISRLRRRRVQQAVLSNKPHALTKQVVELLFPETPFAPVVGQRDDVPRKPSPDGLFEIARLCDVPIERVAMVGDHPIDLQTAVAAGALGIAALWGSRRPDALRRERPEVVLQRPEELLAVLDG